MAKAKTINMLLSDGTLNGVISMENSSWYKGELYSAPRNSVDALISTDVCARFGVYLLLSEDMVYIGQASDLAKRIKQHLIGKLWWERVVILTTSDDSLTRADLDYIEAFLIAKASKVGRLDCDNKTSGNKQKLSKYREVDMLQYLDEALFLLELIGINVFKETTKKSQSKPRTSLITSVVNSSENQLEDRGKNETIRFLREQGCPVGKNVNFASRQKNTNDFWVNPSIKALDKDWDLILNNQFTQEIILLHIPAQTFQMRTETQKGFFPRNDRPQIALSIGADNLTDQRSKCDFSPYVVKRIKY